MKLVLRSRSYCRAAVIAASALFGQSIVGEAQAIRGTDLSFKTSDNFTLKGSWYGPRLPDAGVLVVHQCDRPRDSLTTGYEALADDLARAGVAVFALDLRGYGKSQPLANGASQNAEPNRHVSDVGEAIDFIIENLRTGTRVALVGASCGGRFGLLSDAQRGRLKAAVLLSSRLPAELDIPVSLPVLAVAAEGDPNTGTLASMQRIFSKSQHPQSKLIVYKGYAHGTPLLEQDTDLIYILRNWILRQLEIRPRNGHE